MPLVSGFSAVCIAIILSESMHSGSQTDYLNVYV